MHSMIQFMKFFLLVSPTLQSRFRNQTKNKDRAKFSDIKQFSPQTLPCRRSPKLHKSISSIFLTWPW